MPFTVREASAALNPEGMVKFNSETDSEIENACSIPVPPVNCSVKLVPDVSRATNCAVTPILRSLMAVTTPSGVGVLTGTVTVLVVLVPVVIVILKAFPPLMVCEPLAKPTTGLEVLAFKELEVCAFAGLVTVMVCVPGEAEVEATKLKALV